MYKYTNCPLCREDNKVLLTSGKDYEYFTTDSIFYMYICKTCGHLYLNPKPDIKEFNKIYPDDYYSYDFTDKESIAKKAKKFIEKNIYSSIYKRYAGDGKILDVGCGDGRLISILQSMNKKWKVCGVDFNKKAIERARSKGCYIHEGKFEDINFEKESFDLIIMNELIEHVFDPNSVIKKAYHILKEGGHLIIETPCIGSPDFKIFKNRYWGGYHFPRHINIFSRNSLQTLLKKEGFKIVKKQSLLSPPFWILSIHHLLLDKGFPNIIIKRFNFYNPILLAFFTFIDMININTGGFTSTMRFIAKKRQNEY